MNMFIICALFVGLALASHAPTQHKRYDGYKIMEVEIRSEKHYRVLKAMDENKLIEVISQYYRSGPVQVIVPPAMRPDVLLIWETYGLRYSSLIENIQVELDIEQNRLSRKKIEAFQRRHLQLDVDFDDFNSIDDINRQLGKWVDECPTGLSCATEDLTPQTYEGRNIKLFTVGADMTKPAIWIGTGIHAREWLGPATMLKIIQNFLNQYGSDTQVTNLLDSYVIYWVPHNNPDGYAYTFDADRLWRKNRSPNEGKLCTGTDLNRNFDAEWGTEGVSNNSCSETFCGNGPSSELESQATQNKAKSVGELNGMAAAVAIHAFGRYWMYPYATSYNHDGRNCKLPDNEDDLAYVTDEAVDVLENVNKDGISWKTGSICSTIYPAAGSETDYMYTYAGAKYSYALEVRGSWFVVPASEINKSYLEIREALLRMVEAIEEREN